MEMPEHAEQPRFADTLWETATPVTNAHQTQLAISQHLFTLCMLVDGPGASATTAHWC